MTTPPAVDPPFPIVAAIVFRDGARVVRAGSRSVPAGAQTVTVGTLPAGVDPASVRVTARSASASLVEVEVRRSHRVESFLDEVRQLQGEVDEKRAALQAIEDDDSAESARLGFLSNLSGAAATSLARAVSFGRLDRAELSRMGEQLAGETASALARRRDIDARRREARRELEALEARLADVGPRTESSVPYFDVRVSLDVSADTEVEIELAYHVAGASWRPLYDIRLDGERLELSYLAEVTQETGEDWPEARLSLSTTRRGRHRAIPELSPWSIGLAPKMPPRVLGAGRGASAGMAAPASMAAPAPMPAAAAQAVAPPAPPMMAEVHEVGAALNYQVPRPVPVPADGAPHKVLVTEMELDAELDYVAVPVLALEAYLRATVTNTSTVLLLPGPAHVFYDGEFVGASALETVAPGEEFELQLGVDERIRLDRQLRRRTASKAILGGTRTIDISYEIKVENHRSQPSRISLHDHIPLSRDAEVKVRLREVEPRPRDQDDLGELTWDLTLDPGQELAVAYRFTVEHPAASNVTGLSR